MAPVTASSTGVTRQIIDDVQLKDFLERLCSYDTFSNTSGSFRGASGNKDDDDMIVDGTATATGTARVDVEGLVGELERWPRWKFQEMVRTRSTVV